MSSLGLLWGGAATLLSEPSVILLAAFGVALGIIIGALPGLTATMGVAILLPFTYGLDPLAGLLLISGVFFGGIYGGSITAILLKIPGTPAAAATAMDGYKLTEKGMAGIALGTATLSSFTGGMLSIFVLIFLAPVLAQLSLKFSASDSFALAIFGLSIISSISGASVVKGLMAGFAGLLIATVGQDPMSGFGRFESGIEGFYEIPFIPVMIGLFATSEAFKNLETTQHFNKLVVTLGRIIPPWSTFKKLILTILHSAGLGVGIGMIPGAGADIAAFVAYNESKRFSKNPENYGKGELAAVAACEAGANGCTGGALLPMLTLGIPGDAVTAVMLGALTLQGLQPGPLLFRDHADLVYSLFAGMILCYVLLLIIGMLSLRVVGRLVRIPKPVLTPIILTLCVTGSYALNNSLFDVYVMLAAGVAGYFMQKIDMPASPVVLGLILGPMAESNFRRALSMSNGSYDFIYTRPITATLLSLALLSLVLPVIKRVLKNRKNKGVSA